MRILLVEDEKELSRALAKMLMTEGYDVDTVYDGADGLSFSLSGLYDLIILDVIMPKKNGFEVLTEIRHRGLETPVLMLTALGDEKDKVAGLDKGADDYLAKPFSYGELSARIRALLRRRGKLVADNRLVYSNTTLDKACHFVLFITKRGEHKHRCFKSTTADFSQHLKSVFLGHNHVQNYQIVKTGQ